MASTDYNEGAANGLVSSPRAPLDFKESYLVKFCFSVGRSVLEPNDKEILVIHDEPICSRTVCVVPG